jgi:hypothetical protein
MLQRNIMVCASALPLHRCPHQQGVKGVPGSSQLRWCQVAAGAVEVATDVLHPQAVIHGGRLEGLVDTGQPAQVLTVVGTG